MKFLTTAIILLFLSLNLIGTTFATVNGEKVTIEDINIILGSYKESPPYNELSKEDKEFILNQAIEAKLIQQTAKNEKVQTREDYKESLAKIEKQLLIEIWMKTNLEKITVTKEEVEKSYKENITDYKQPFQVKARHIVVETQKEAQDIINELNNTKTDIQAKFIELANTKSIEPSANTRGGDLGWFKKGDMLEEFWQEAVSLQELSYSTKPLQTPFGYHIVFLDGKKEPYTIHLVNVYSQIEDKLKMDKLQLIITDKLEEIKKNARISIN
jgi:peptidylprolyl isomerase